MGGRPPGARRPRRPPDGFGCLTPATNGGNEFRQSATKIRDLRRTSERVVFCPRAERYLGCGSRGKNLGPAPLLPSPPALRGRGVGGEGVHARGDGRQPFSAASPTPLTP